MDIVYTFEDIFVNDFVRKREIPAEERIRRRDWRPYSLREGGKPPRSAQKIPENARFRGFLFGMSFHFPVPNAASGGGEAAF